MTNELDGLDKLLAKLSAIAKSRLVSQKQWISEQNRVYFFDKQYTWQAWRNCQNRLANPLETPKLADLIAEQKRLDDERINIVIAESSKHAKIEADGIRLLHESQMQLLEAQQQNRRINELYKKVSKLK